jgi:type IV pilus assembly protein PilE
MQSFRIRRRKSIRGLTLIELLMVIVIVGVLAAIAVPTYSNYMIRARRADAKTALEHVRAAQEMWRAEKGCYAQDGVDCLGGASAGSAVTKLQTTMGAPPTQVGDYAWSFTALSATAFTARATPNRARQTSDGWLAINQDGTKTDQNGFVYPDSRCKWTK